MDDIIGFEIQVCLSLVQVRLFQETGENRTDFADFFVFRMKCMQIYRYFM